MPNYYNSGREKQYRQVSSVLEVASLEDLRDEQHFVLVT